MLSFVENNNKSDKPRRRKANKAFKHTNNIFDTDNVNRQQLPSQSYSQESYTTVTDRLSRSPVSELERRIEKLPPRLRRKVIEAIAKAQRESVQSQKSNATNEDDERFIGYQQRSRSFELPKVNLTLAGKARAVTAYTQGHLRR